MALELVQGDITQLDVDVLVNAANAALQGGGGVDGAIHRAAGPELLRACQRIGRCPTGQAVLTPGFQLKAHHVAHAVGPIWQGGRSGEPALLRRAYLSAFARAREVKARSIAFPAISAGVYRFPHEEAARIAVTAMREHEAQFDRIVACLFDAAMLEIYQRVCTEL